jgi:hypothetical protein
MDNIEKLYRSASLIRLQMPDQVPFNSGAPDLRDLVFGFLDFVFAKYRDSRS